MRWFHPTGALLAGLIVMAGCSSTPSSPEQASEKPKAEEGEASESADKQRAEGDDAEASPEPSCEEVLEGRRQVWADLSRAPEQIIYYIGGERCEPER
ncbi:hypothetical protein [Halorhodospira halophila]|uniref:hypothetical protein n=1 Tax=Halorhodospira halophila TaxID=1053 RepID=UPI001914D50D|nr:hypothetical protein [Halorhodospira halophila]MBK5942942.1 hypothetical protein [Halorhodospira halophila]